MAWGGPLRAPKKYFLLGAQAQIWAHGPSVTALGDITGPLFGDLIRRVGQFGPFLAPGARVPWPGPMAPCFEKKPAGAFFSENKTE